MRAAALQFDVALGDVAANLAAAEQGLREAARRELDLVVLPEMWPSSFCEAEPELQTASEGAVERVREVSAELGLVVCGSAWGPAEPGGPPSNRLHVFDAGRAVLAYDKVHLHSPTAEEQSFRAGARPPATAETRAGLLTGVVCYDLRFGALLQAALDGGAEILICVAQWPSARAAHWRALVLGRAVEHQCCVVAANRTGTSLIGRKRRELRFPGNSLIADPHGNALAEGRGEPGLVAAELELDEVRSARVRVPVRKDARPRLYERWRRGEG